jgi:hypothetical protein
MKDITEITREEYDEMNECPEITWEAFIDYLPEQMIYTESEANWLKEHDYNTDSLITLPYFIFGKTEEEEHGHS